MIAAEPTRRRLRLGMIGGGAGAFIGAVHRMSARLDDRFELVAGALSSDALRGHASAAALGLARGRSYENVEAFVAGEVGRPDGVEAVVIVTPNYLHYDAAVALLQAGFHVLCEKPLTTTLDEARFLARTAAQRGRVVAVSYTYAGYPMVRLARKLVASGRLGSVRFVEVEYLQDWLATPIERSGNKQAAWRTDPRQSGAAGALGDIGTHAFHLAEFVSGLRCQALLGERSRFVADRVLDDDVRVMLRFGDQARGRIWASQVAIGRANDLRLRVFGEAGSLEWHQETPDSLSFTVLDGTMQTLRRGRSSDYRASIGARLPAGHPEGFIEALGQIYVDFADRIEEAAVGRQTSVKYDMPDVGDGVRGMEFVDAVIRSEAADNSWVACDARISGPPEDGPADPSAAGDLPIAGQPVRSA